MKGRTVGVTLPDSLLLSWKSRGRKFMQDVLFTKNAQVCWEMDSCLLSCKVVVKQRTLVTL